MDSIKDLNKNIIEMARARKVELSSQISQCDLAITDALHYLENERCDAVSMVKTAKVLKELRQKRRVVKIEYEQTKKMLSIVGGTSLEGYEKQAKYNYRTKVMDDIRKNNNTK